MLTFIYKYIKILIYPVLIYNQNCFQFNFNLVQKSNNIQ